MKRSIQQIISVFSLLSRPRTTRGGREEQQEEIQQKENPAGNSLQHDMVGQESIPLDAIMATATITPKERNCDSAALINNPQLKMHGIVLADGIGDAPRTEDASRFVTDYMQQELESLLSKDHIDLQKLFVNCQRSFAEFFGQTIQDPGFGTTVILALVDNSKEVPIIRMAYAGNGSIFCIRNNFHRFHFSRTEPWNMVNLLCPHTIEEKGKEVLYNHIGLHDSIGKYGATEIVLTQDRAYPSILVLCTDGISSLDHLGHSVDGLGHVWTRTAPAYFSFINRLRASLNPESNKLYPLEKWLNEYLQNLQTEQLLEDDATIGILMIPQSLSHDSTQNDKSQ
jgi:hypothetical protein